MPCKEEEALNLSAKYESYLLAQGVPAQTEIPACVVTGFLGSGKTTLLAHLLRNRGGLRFAVLINEVGAVDLDSQLIDVGHVHASHGLPQPSETALAGGCVCCSASEGLEASLVALKGRHMSGGGELDYLVVETSGVADAGPLAAILIKNGFRLEAVVAVVDAEAGVDTLEQQVAQAQVRCADVVVINKCDIAGLSVTADVEDRVQLLSPGVRMIRARYGQVPLPSLLDVEVCCAPSTSPSAPTIQGEVGFLSHEAVITNTSGPRYKVAGRLSKLATSKTLDPAAQGGTHDGHGMLQGHQDHQGDQDHQGHQSHSHATTLGNGNHSHASMDNDHAHGDHGHATMREGHSHTSAHGDNGHATMHDHHSHARLHEGFHTVSVTRDVPISLAAFQLFAAVLTRLPGVYRAKGILWFSEARTHRYTFHLSGRMRVECLRGEPWTSPPRLQLVMIGNDVSLLGRLKAAFEAMLVPAPISCDDGLSQQQLVCAERVRQGLAQLHERLEVLQPQGGEPQAMAWGGAPAGAPQGGEPQAMAQAGATQSSAQGGSQAGATQGAAQGRTQVGETHREIPPPVGAQAAATPGPPHTSHVTGGVGGPLVEFSVVGDPLHGVQGSEVNAGILRRANATLPWAAGLLVLGVPAPPGLSGVSGAATHGGGERVVRLQVLPDPRSPLLLLRGRGGSQGAGLGVSGALAGTAASLGHAATGGDALKSWRGAGGAGAQCLAGDMPLVPFELMQLVQLVDPQAGLGTEGEGGAQRGHAGLDGEGEGGVQGGHEGVGEAAEVFVSALQECIVPALRRAFPHTGCRCDVAGIMISQ